MKSLKRLWIILKRTGALKLFLFFVLLVLISAILLTIVEQDMDTVREALWYCYVSAATIGFGDLYATTFVGRVITIIMSSVGILVTAFVTGIIVSYYMEYLKDKQNDTISTFLEKLERLPELSKKELEEISDKVKKFDNKK